MPAAIWRSEHIAVARTLLSGRGEWGQAGILEKRKSRDKEGRGQGSRQSLKVWFWTQQGRHRNTVTILKHKAGSSMHVARQCIPIPTATQPPLALPPTEQSPPKQAWSPQQQGAGPGEQAMPSPARASPSRPPGLEHGKELHPEAAESLGEDQGSPTRAGTSGAQGAILWWSYLCHICDTSLNCLRFVQHGKETLKKLNTRWSSFPLCCSGLCSHFKNLNKFLGKFSKNNSTSL